ncbi:MAG: chromosome segregation protein SMC, partial [bacterium]
MKFNRLEMLGFKSFVDRTVIEFGDQLTAIVGPNGCGKSNISDAIRWVLGEQGPRNLRAKKMEDVIFNGSSERKPLGMAEVSLTISDLKGVVTSPEYKDYDELVVTRRLYRSGESEYLINRNPCRLKDIVDIFLDTGVSLDTFSIVEQGRIESLVNAKPLDRRILIEEAAGIMKYKTRRNEALRKLELAQANLLRIGDVMREKESRMRSLRRQARKATFHKEYQQEIRDLEVRIASLDLLRLEAELEPAEGSYTRKREESEGHMATLSAREAERERCRIEVAERSEALAETRRRAVEVEGYLQRLENRWEMLSSRLLELDGEDERRREEVESLRQETKQLEAEHLRLGELEKSLSEEVAKAQDQYDVRAGELTSLRAELSKWEADENETREVKSREAEALSRARQRMASGETRREAIHESIERVEREHSESTRACERTREEINALSAHLSEVSNEVAYTKEESEKASRERSRIEDLLREGDTAIASLRETLVGSRSSLQVIENLENGPSLERIGAGDFRSLGVEVKGLLRDLLTVEARYEKAIEAALGANLLGIVVPDSESATAALKALASSGIDGRGLLLPENTRLNAAPRIPRHEGVEGGALEFVRCAEEYRPLVTALLAGVGVARDLDAAMAAWSSGPEGIVWVTLDGELIYASGGVEGGAKSDVQVGLLGRKRRTEELRSESEKKQSQLDRLEQEQASRRELLVQAEEEADSLAQKVRETELALVELQSARKALK